MSERLKKQSLTNRFYRRRSKDFFAMNGFDGPVMAQLVANNDALRARVAKLEAALKNIAKQMIKDEMDEQQLKYADYEDAYEIMIKVARDALKDAPQ